MSPRITLTLALAALAAAGCAPPPPPAPPPEPTAEPAPPPPPKCESLGEKCAGKAGTKAKITSSNLVFAPAVGWFYAQQSSATVAQASESGPAIAFLGVEFDAKKEAAAKDAVVTELAKQLGLTPLKRKVPWKAPMKKTPGAIKVDLWQLDEAGQRGAKKGPLLVVAAQASEGKAVIGLGFVPDDDTTKADELIMKSIESLGTAQ